MRNISWEVFARLHGVPRFSRRDQAILYTLQAQTRTLCSELIFTSGMLSPDGVLRAVEGPPRLESHLHTTSSVRETQIAPFPLCLRDGDELVRCTRYTLPIEPRVPSTLQIGLNIYERNGSNNTKYPPPILVWSSRSVLLRGVFRASQLWKCH